jgi:two-component system OmpR family response regulator
MPVSGAAPRILVVEDEPVINQAVTDRLRGSGYDVVQAWDGPGAVAQFADTAPDLVLLDVMLPGFDGHEVCRRIQAERPVPVLMLTARDDEADILVGLGVGADDYLTKPFRMEELLARVRALIRRSTGHGYAFIEAGGLSLDTRQMRILAEGTQVPVSPLEYRLVAFLMHHKGRVVPAGELIEHLYGDDDARDANALEALIMRLRKKLGAGSIETRRGFGYLIADETS